MDKDGKIYIVVHISLRVLKTTRENHFEFIFSDQVIILDSIIVFLIFVSICDIFRLTVKEQPKFDDNLVLRMERQIKIMHLITYNNLGYRNHFPGVG